MSNKKPVRVKRNGRFILWYAAAHQIPLKRIAKIVGKTESEFILYCLDGLTEEMENYLFDKTTKIIDKRKKAKWDMENDSKERD